MAKKDLSRQTATSVVAYKVPVQLAKEQRDHAKAMEALSLSRAARDDMISHVRNSGMSYQQIEDSGGPTVTTLMAWELGTVNYPRISTLALCAKVIGLRVVFIDSKSIIVRKK